MQIANSGNDLLPVGLIAQLVEHCTGISEAMGSNLVQAVKVTSKTKTSARDTALRNYDFFVDFTRKKKKRLRGHFHPKGFVPICYCLQTLLLFSVAI